MNFFQRLAYRIAGIAHELQAQHALAHGQTALAIFHAEAFQGLQPDNPTANFLLAQSYLEIGRHQDALQPLQRVIQSWPNDAPAWYALGVCHDYLDQPQEAIGAYRRTLQIAPHWIVALKHLGRCAWRSGNIPLGKDALTRYCRFVPNDKEAHDLLGYLAYEQGQLRAAYSHYLQASHLDPGNPKLDRNARLLYMKSATS